MEVHNKNILNQFTKQADGFSKASGIKDKSVIDLTLRCINPNKEDRVLDVACGPGILTCALAKKTKHATGVDVVPAMLDKARELQESLQLNNLTWETGDVYDLPYEENSFSIVVCRYSFHHLENPKAALLEMKRVCQPGGKVAVIDMISSENEKKSEAFNQMEKLRDPSHTRALPLTELKKIYKDAEIGILEIKEYSLKNELESFLKRSFPEEGNPEKIRTLLRRATKEDFMGIQAEQKADTIKFSYPTSILVGQK